MTKNYESPQIEVIEIEAEGVLCGSLEGTTNNGYFGLN